YRLRLAGPKSLTPGSYVRVSGTRRGSLMRVRSVRRVTPGTTATRRLAARAHVLAAPAAPQLAVILFNFANDTSQPWTPAAITSTVFTGAASAAAYYSEQSFSKTTLTGTVFGWYTIAATNAGCDFATWANQASAAAGTAINGYSHVMYVFPTAPSCGWAGLGALSGPETWINGYANLRVMTHELGHNFGVHHASSVNCHAGATRVALAADAGCDTPDEYGDPFSIMGGASTRQFPAFHKGELGWLQPTSTYTVASSGTYTIAASELDTSATQLLKIPRTGGALYVDVRQPFGTYFDNFTAGSSPVNGVMIRRGPATYDRTQPAILDATPDTATFADASLQAGRSVTDPVSGVTITTNAITASGATVTVTVPGTGTAPSAPSNVAAQVAGNGIDVTWSAATDDISVTGYRIFREGVQIGTTSGLAFHDPVLNGVFSYGVAAVDSESLVGPVAAAPDVSIGDGVAPTAPTSLAATVAGATITLTWQASTDNVGVTGYRVYRSNAFLKTTTATSVQDTRPGGTTSTYSVRAVDAAGNLSPPSAPLPVTIADGTPPTAVTLLKVAVHPKPWGATLTWKGATDDVGVAGYRVYRDAALIKTVAALTYTDPALPHTDMSVYAVAAVDATGNEGPRARIAAIPPEVDLIAPTKPGAFRAKALTKRRVRLSWAPARDDVSVVRYDVIVAGRLVLRTSKRMVTIKLKGKRGKRVVITLLAADAAGNRSKVVRATVRLR
ncbi:MAG: large repetitive protein, partial [Solirubrobacteraceae bacterium]|nr:large repetitive protein [Solirubrobacteraceae bacterium]